MPSFAHFVRTDPEGTAKAIADAIYLAPRILCLPKGKPPKPKFMREYVRIAIFHISKGQLEHDDLDEITTLTLKQLIVRFSKQPSNP